MPRFWHRRPEAVRHGHLDSFGGELQKLLPQTAPSLSSKSYFFLFKLLLFENFQIQLGKKYSIFIPMVHKVLMKQKINHQHYEIVCARVMQGGSPTDFDDALLRRPRRRRQGKKLSPRNSNCQQLTS
jgi:hypothetical protein